MAWIGGRPPRLPCGREQGAIPQRRWTSRAFEDKMERSRSGGERLPQQPACQTEAVAETGFFLQRVLGGERVHQLVGLFALQPVQIGDETLSAFRPARRGER